jgi:hypothetical protein
VAQLVVGAEHNQTKPSKKAGNTPAWGESFDIQSEEGKDIRFSVCEQGKASIGEASMKLAASEDAVELDLRNNDQPAGTLSVTIVAKESDPATKEI